MPLIALSLDTVSKSFYFDEVISACGALYPLDLVGKLESGDLVGFIGGSSSHEVGATYMEFTYVP